MQLCTFRTCLQLLSWLLQGSLLLVSPFGAGGASYRHTGVHVPGWNVLPALPTCKAVLSRLSENEIAVIRSWVQLMGYHKRREKEYEWILHHKQATAAQRRAWVEGQALAYKTNLTEQQLQDHILQHHGQYEQYMALTSQEVKALQDSGQLDRNYTVSDVKKCVYGRTNPHLYPGRPKVSFLMQYFRRPWAIEPLVNSLRGCANFTSYEVLVNVDSPEEALQWANMSQASLGVVVPVLSANVHEIRGYNRLAHMARGDYLVLMADDDTFPSNCSWLADMAALFEAFPLVGVMGMRKLQYCWNLSNLQRHFFRHNATGVVASWVQRADMAPLGLRRSAFLHVGGMDETLSEAGECGIMSDWELCMRMWVAGWQVMAMRPVAIEHNLGEGASHRPEAMFRCWSRQQGLAMVAMQDHQDQALENEVCREARRLNLAHLSLINPARCPYREGCKAA